MNQKLLERYVAFPNGDISTFIGTRPQLEEWRRLTKGAEGALDVTPKKLNLTVHFALLLNDWWRKEATSLRFFACPDCSDGSSRWLVCETCGGTRKVPTLAWWIGPYRPLPRKDVGLQGPSVGNSHSAILADPS